nr:immunoglobulin heavy chain junction region [Macaca mulatta]MOW48104.1 immunoglobulin heavy chain junction region [Macaca mulatta]MOW49720.1 immunoglobulin heavy chain junction region [Macaca mulatta]MOW51174.1 immunoglobulin heavy chain junction region [Macaca mulatta]MOW51321.1 immunoglobulin heavy chain junction region [Macaca mulatta]
CARVLGGYCSGIYCYAGIYFEFW